MRFLHNQSYSGFAIALAWPETYCKQAGSWYDLITGMLGISKNHHYKAGHAALLLVNKSDGKCHYFDFGRYHAPYKHGRVRNAVTDNGLTVRTEAKISNDGGMIENFEEIITELQYNSECHGDGRIYASYCMIDFMKAYKKALSLQESSPLPYGPFIYNGTNCSRFVSTCILAGMPKLKYRLSLKCLIPFTPTPLSNVNALNNRVIIRSLRTDDHSSAEKLNGRIMLNSTLPEYDKPDCIPGDAKWLSGEGAGSWFAIEKKADNYKIRRFGPDGSLECENLFFIANNQPLDLSKSFRFDHLSHCERARIIQDGKRIDLHSINVS
jgi:hypothetical protein